MVRADRNEREERRAPFCGLEEESRRVKSFQHGGKDIGNATSGVGMMRSSYYSWSKLSSAALKRAGK